MKKLRLRQNLKWITTGDVVKTNAFQQLTEARKRLVNNRNAIKHIDNAIGVVRSIGLEAWLNQTQARSLTKEIVTEIHNKNGV